MERKMGWFARDVIAPALGRKRARMADQMWDVLQQAGRTPVGRLVPDEELFQQFLMQGAWRALSKNRTPRR